MTRHAIWDHWLIAEDHREYAAGLLPNLDSDDGLRIVRSAAARSDPDLVVDVTWLYTVARRQG